MDHFKQEKSFKPHKFGFHYFLNDERFNHEDAKLWVHKLKEINANWLVVNNPRNRAIPEEFIKPFSASKIDLIINFNEKLPSTYDVKNIEPLLSVYGKWGVKYACLFEQPNLSASWGEIEWNNNNIVKTHLNKFIHFSQICIDHHIQPIFSPLYPGGDYWDLAFLEESLKELSQSAYSSILNNMILSAYGWTWGHTIDWGAGGNKIWGNSKPFLGKQDNQNQMGFRTYEWYLEISKKILKQKLPIIIFAAGFDNTTHHVGFDETANSLRNRACIPNLLAGGNVYDPLHSNKLLSSIPNDVIACNLFVLSACTDKRYFPYRWFTSTGEPLEIAKIFGSTEKISSQPHEEGASAIDKPFKDLQFKFHRYILISDLLKHEMPNLLEKLDPYIRKYKPQIGFSKSDARDSAYVLVIAENKKEFLLDENSSLFNKNIIKIITPTEICQLQGDIKNE